MQMRQADNLMMQIWELKKIAEAGQTKAQNYGESYAQVLAATVIDKLDTIITSLRNDPPAPLTAHRINKYQDMVIDGRYLP